MRLIITHIAPVLFALVLATLPTLSSAQSSNIDLTRISFVYRLTIGSLDPENIKSDKIVAEEIAFLNMCLSNIPVGRIIAIENSFDVRSTVEQQNIVLPTIYHIGWPRKPAWFDVAEARLRSLLEAR